MRKLLLLVLVALLATSVISVSAIGESDLTTLASYVENEALLFASTRTDDGFVDSLDTLFERISPFLPRGTLPPGANASTLLDQTLLNMGVGTFDEAIRPWLGDTAAFALFAPESPTATPPFLVLVEVDGDAAQEFFEPFLEATVQEGDLERYEVNGFTVYESTNEYDSTSLAFTDDALFLVSHVDLLPLEGVDNPLSANALFNDTISSLPEESYLMLMYSNMQELQRYSLATSGLDPAALPQAFDDLLDIYGGLAIGFTMLNGDTLVLDMVQVLDPSAYEEFGLEIVSPSELDYDFTNHIPDDAVLVVQSSDFGPTVQAGFANIRAFADYIEANGGLGELADPEGELFSDEERRVLNQVDPAWVIGATNFTFAGFTGLNLERQVLPVLDGDVALYLGLTLNEDFVIPVVPNGALLFQSSDADGAIAIIEQLGVSAEAYELGLSQEDYGNGTALVLPAEEGFGIQFADLDLMLGSSNGILALGTRGAVNAVQNTDNGLADNAAFQNASQYFIADSQQMIYYGAEPVMEAFDAMLMSGDIPADEDTELIYTAISLVESASISGTVSADGLTTIRFAITLSEEPRPFPVVPDA